jgi:putative copper export protein
LAAVLALLVPLVVLAEAVRPELVRRVKGIQAAQQQVVAMVAVEVVVLEVQVAQA